MKKYTSWVTLAAVLQLVTAGLHSLSFINDPIGNNETERQLITLMKSYKMDLGNGFTPTMENIMTSNSISFVLLFVSGGVINLYLLKKVDASILKGVILTNVIIFGICFLTMCIFTFLPPIICTGLILIALLISMLKIKATVS